MRVTVFKLGNVMLFPISRQKGRTARYDVDHTRYAVPGREIVCKEDIPALAKRLGVTLREESQHIFMPLGMER